MSGHRSSSSPASAEQLLNEAAGALLGVNTRQLNEYVSMLVEAVGDDHAAYLIGNGGSAATASHHANDLAKTASGQHDRPLRAHCLSDNTALLTATANDISYDEVFDYLLRTYGRLGDLLIIFTTSAKSPNLLRGARAARELGVTSVAFTGSERTALHEECSLTIQVPSSTIGVVEGLHSVLAHVCVSLFTQRLRRETK